MPQDVSGLSKKEAEDLLDYLEAAGYGPAQLSYIEGEGFRIRLPFGTKGISNSKQKIPERIKRCHVEDQLG